MVAKVSHVSWSSLPVVLFQKTLSFLDAREVALTERVSNKWRRQVASNGGELWKVFYIMKGQSVPVLGLPSPMRARLQLVPDGLEVGMPDVTDKRVSNCRWGMTEDSLYVTVQLRHEAGDDLPLPKALEKFPTLLPLKLFLRQNGGCKETGDLIRVTFHEKRVELVCSDRVSSDDKKTPIRFFTSLFKSVFHVIKTSEKNCALLTQAQESAKVASDWIDADYREPLQNP